MIVNVGAYYIDGWTGRTGHIKDRLVREFIDREPLRGCRTDTPNIVREQIDLAAEAGIGFFAWM
jgi:hypothetical protein